jgi:chromosome segregation ATPase
MPEEATMVTEAEFHKGLSDIKQDIREIMTLLNERRDSVKDAQKNIGEAFDAIKKLQAQNTDTLNEIRRLAERLPYQDQRIGVLENAVGELRMSMQTLKETMIKYSLAATAFVSLALALAVRFWTR